MAWYIAFYQGLVQLVATSLLLLIVASVAILAIRQPARRIRAIEWTLGGLLLLPGLVFVPGYPRWSILPSLDKPAARVVVVEERVEPTEPAEVWPSMSIETSADPMEEPTDDVLVASIEPRMIVQAEAEPAVFARVTTRSATVPIVRQPQLEFAFSRDSRFWIVILYLSGVAGMALWSLVGLVALKRLLRSARPADAACRDLLREIAGPRSDRVALLVSARACQPCAFACWRATIVLPRELCDAEDSQKLRWALAHEWSHVERGDVWTWSASGIVRCFYFYQPLLWWLRRQLQLSQDFVADAQAAKNGNLPEDYAEFLTTWSAGYSRPTLAAGLGIGGRVSDLHRRIVMLVEYRRPLETFSPRMWNLAVFPIAVLILGAVACVGQQPDGASGEPKQAVDRKPATEPKAVVEPTLVIAPAAETDSTQPVPSDTAIGPVSPKAADPKPSHKQVAPRKIARGDALIVEVIPNIESSQDGQARVLLRPEMKMEVDENGKISFGSIYGFVSVLESTLGEAQEQIQKHLIAAQLLDHINVRVTFAEPAGNKGAKVQTPAGLIQYAAPAASTGPKPPTQSWAKELKHGYVAPQPVATFKNEPQPRRIKPGDTFNIEVEGTPDDHPVKPVINVDADGRVALGAHYGKVNIQGKTLDEAEQTIREFLLKTLKNPQVQLTYRDTGPPSGAVYSAPTAYSAAPTVSPYVRVLPNLEIDPVPANQPKVKSWAGPNYSNETLVSPTPPRIKPDDILDIEIAGGLLDVPPRIVAVVESSGRVALGVHYGRVEVRGKT
jgi:beta-lactamase regulating signal transducer with metallopeptidase domain/protein involved in polysaccharide export with SLBB domain